MYTYKKYLKSLINYSNLLFLQNSKIFIELIVLHDLFVLLLHCWMLTLTILCSA